MQFEIPFVEFRLPQTFLSELRGKSPDWGPLGEVTYLRTYSKVLPDGSQESWADTCQRVTETVFGIQRGHCARIGLPWDQRKALRTAKEFCLSMFEFKWLPPGRGLAKMDIDVLNKVGGAAVLNCGFYSTRDIGDRHIEGAFAAPFCWLMSMSMLGVGVGMDTLGANKISIRDDIEDAIDNGLKYEVEDSREGWVSYVEELLESLVRPRKRVPLGDYSKVRPRGAPIVGFGGTASGPGALERLTTNVLRLACLYAGKPVDSRVITDIANSIGEAVVAGGTRRSAEIVFGGHDDVTFRNLKNWALAKEENSDMADWPRWASNNSVVINSPDELRAAVEGGLAAQIAVNGEPGILFLENARAYGRMADPPNYRDEKAAGANPCVEQTLESQEGCCLVENFPSRATDLDEFTTTLKYSYLYAKTVTLIPTHHEGTNAIQMRNRRIGCSLSGVLDAIGRVGLTEFRRWLATGYEAVQEYDRVYSDWLAIPRSIKTTSIKPSGTVSKLPGVREGLHDSKGAYEIQRMRIQESSPLIPSIKAAGYHVEPAKKEANTVVVEFLAEYPSREDRDLTIWEQLELAAILQGEWADNQVSVTVDFDPATEGPLIGKALETYATRLKGLSFLPRAGHGYVQAPKEVIDRATYEKRVATLKPLDFSQVTGTTRDSEEKFCDGGVCEIGPRE